MRRKDRAVDALLLLMAIIWGTNFSIVKSAFRELHPQAFNAMRMGVASAALLAVMAFVRLRPPGGHDGGPYIGIFRTPEPITARDWLNLAWLGIVGHALYQYFFIGGLARTSVANSSLMLAATPVVIAVIGAAFGHDRSSGRHWLGIVVSAFGIYLVVGQGASFGGASAAGDLMMFGAVCCWALYTFGARPLMSRHSPVAVTGLSMALGTSVYIPLVWPRVAAVSWLDVSGWTMFLLVYSAIFALCVSYTIWYVAVRQIGTTRTAGFQNLVPIVAMLSAVVFLDEPIGLSKALGAAAVLAGVALTRSATSAASAPAEE